MRATARRSSLILVMCASLIGCQISTAPTGVSQFDQHHAVSMMRAPWNGQYTLYLVQSKGQRKSIQMAHLKKDDPLGFRQRETGPVAVAGELELPLPAGEYEWVMQADQGQPNWLATTGLVVLIAAVVVGILIAVVAIEVNNSLNHGR
jgi:hypothetical protein